MYGLVNKAIRDLVVNNYGAEPWKRICEKVGFFEEDFLGMSPYPDKLTYDLVFATAEELNTEPGKVLELFGEHWILYTAEGGYSDIIRMTGETMPEFLSNLDFLHDRIKNVMPELNPPLFTTRNETEQSIEIEYRTKRAGLTPMVIGILRGTGKRFGLDVAVEHIEQKSENGDCDVFRVSW
jgi:hypothetical protein